ncbi:hypothetical protein PPYR_09805 [Photinus pyralis]|uniref:Uncharacterized protein n=1 Tax=Photinus pyralis TaxID=7054 RepID=A0A5N4AEL4_PHOPY|nr:hypothetical protein PPYR_09805 [Photinus pyralis]
MHLHLHGPLLRLPVAYTKYVQVEGICIMHVNLKTHHPKYHAIKNELLLSHLWNFCLQQLIVDRPLYESQQKIYGKTKLNIFKGDFYKAGRGLNWIKTYFKGHSNVLKNITHWWRAPENLTPL